MKVKELIDYLKQLNQEKDICISDDGEFLHIESYLDGDIAYVLGGTYFNSLPYVEGDWKDFE